MKIPSLLCIVVAFASQALAELPPFKVSPFTVTLKLDPRYEYRVDPLFKKDGKIIYPLTGQVFYAPEGKITPADGPTKKSTPWETLSELLTANKAKDIEAVKTLYDSPEHLDRIVANPAMKELWTSMVEKNTQATVLFAYTNKENLIAFVRFEGPQGSIQPLSFVKVGEQYMLNSKVSAHDPVFVNISLALVNYRIPYTEIISR